MPNWVDRVVESTKEAESPERFQYWSALAAISAAIGKKVFLDRYYYKLYPNLYIFLVAKSGLRKGNPIILTKKLMQECPSVRVISGRNSVQMILKDLGKAHSMEGGGVMKSATGFLISGELAAFLIKDPEALTILTDLYDTHANEPEWKNSTKTQGVDTLKEPCLTLLGATNEDHFKDAVPQTAIGGGFIARTLIVYESKRRVINSLMYKPKVVPNVKDLAVYLKEIAKLSGEFTISPEVMKYYDDWYHSFTLESGLDKTGTIERMGDTVLKVAMCLALSETLTLEITMKAMVEAVTVCVDCLTGLKHVTMGAGKSELAEETSMILKELLKSDSYRRTRKQLLQKYWGDFDSVVLDRIVESLLGAGAVIVQDAGKERFITLTPEAIKLYTQFKKEIN